MLSRTDVERDRYQARLKWERDQTAYIDEAREQGKLIARIQLWQDMLKLPVTPEQDLLSCTLDELRAQAARLEQQMRDGKNGVRREIGHDKTMD